MPPPYIKNCEKAPKEIPSVLFVLFVKNLVLPEIHGRAKHQCGDDGAFPEGPFGAEDEGQNNTQQYQANIDFLAEFSHGDTQPVCDELDAAFHGRTHQMRFQNHRNAESTEERRGHRYDQADRVEGEGDILQYSIEKKVQYCAAQDDIGNL